MKNFVKVSALLGTVATASMADVDVSGLSLNTGSVETMAVTMLGALGIIWVARKVIGFLK